MMIHVGSILTKNDNDAVYVGSDDELITEYRNKQLQNRMMSLRMILILILLRTIISCSFLPMITVVIANE